MAMTTEKALGRAVMEVLASQPKREATVRTLIKNIPDHVDLTDDDHKPSTTRQNEEIWEQRVRNLKSHDKSTGNVIAEGLVEHVGHGRYKLTDAGWFRLKG